MIAVIETESGFEPVAGNPTLTSLDGEIRAPLAVVLHESWTAEERAKFGVYLVEPMEIPAGKVPVGMPRYERDRDGSVVQVRDLEDEKPEVVLEPAQKVDSMMAKFGLSIEELRAVLGGATR